jgi:hypothetical protein
MEGRKPDMSPGAAQALCAVLGHIAADSTKLVTCGQEAAKLLDGNRTRVIQDILNAGPKNIDGKDLTQTNLQRVSSSNKSIVEAMYREVVSCLGGKAALTTPSAPAEIKVWAAAARYLSGRTQGAPEEMRGRNPDMSFGAAAALRMVLEQISQSEKFTTASIEAAQALMANRENVVMDIANPSNANINGGGLTQKSLERVDSSDKPSVNAMFDELCGRLQGKAGAKKPSAQDARVWAVAARYLAKRVQGTPEAMPGRKADMSSGAAQAMCVVLGQIGAEADEIAAQNGAIEASQRLLGNRDKVVKDIVNPAPITQRELLRVDSKHEARVNEMITEVCNRLEMKAAKKPSAQEAPVWAVAADYLSARIQGSPASCPGRKADMSVHAANALHAVLAQIGQESAAVCAWNGANEAAQLLKANRERVAQDIANSGRGRKNIDGHGLTQGSLDRVDSKHKTVVDAMLIEVCNRLEGKGSNSKPSTVEEIAVWTTAAAYLAQRVQGAAAECPGRRPDMSAGAAKALKEVLGKLEAGYKLEANRVRVAQDIANAGPTNIDGKKLTQTELKRVSSADRATVEAMIGEVCNNLQGKAATKKPSVQDASVWAAAARYLSKRVQGTRGEMPGRKPDMSTGAATALRSALEAVAGDGAARQEAAQALKVNQKKVVADIVNPGPKNIDGIVLTQKNLDRVDSKHQAVVDAMINEVCGRLQGTSGRKPSTSEEAIVWAAAASYLSKRVQGSPTDMPGRKTDMSYAAAAALRAVLAEFC